MFANNFVLSNVLIVLFIFLPIYVYCSYQNDENAKWSIRKYTVETTKVICSAAVSVTFAMNAFRNYQKILLILGFYKNNKAIIAASDGFASLSNLSNLTLEYNRLFNVLKRNKGLSLDIVNLVGSVYLCFKTGLYSLNKCGKIIGL